MAKSIREMKQGIAEKQDKIVTKSQEEKEAIEIDQLISDISAKPSKEAAKPKAKKAAGKEKKVAIKATPK